MSVEKPKEVVIEFLGAKEDREFWKAVKEDLHSRVLSSN